MVLDNEYRNSYLCHNLGENKIKRTKRMLVIDNERIKYDKELKKYKKMKLLNEKKSFYEKLLIILNCNN